MCSLSALNASHNKLEGVPEGIDGCTSLVELLLSNNSIAAIPGSISQLQALRTLNLRANR
jgi:Leucine-rich repeat (LRR) protein